MQTTILCALVAVLMVGGGCHQPSANLTYQERNRIEQRAMGLLLRAAQSELPLVRTNAIEALVDLAPQDNLLVFRAAVASEAPVVRYAGCVALGQARDEVSRDALLAMLSDPSPQVRLAAAFAACRCGDQNAARLLVDTLNDHPDEKLRAEAAYLIGRLGESKAQRRLRLALDREKSNHVRLHILTALAMLGDDNATDALVYFTQSDLNSRLIALQSLSELAPPRAKDALLRVFNDETYYLQARLIAARALGKLGVDKGYELALKSLARTEKNLSETMQVRVNGALALGAIADPQALPALRQLAESEDDPRTQVAACYAICQILRASSPGG